MNKQRKFVLIFAAAGIISMFLPWISVSVFGYSQTENGMHDVGILTFLSFAVIAVIAYLGDQSKNFDKTMWPVVLIAGAVALLSIIWFYSKANNSIMGSSLIGFGLYISAVAAIGVLASAYMFRSANDNLKDGLTNLKNEIENKMNRPTPPTSRSSTDDSNIINPEK
ncbi:MAG: hypothetical protein M3139_03885 [Bacteroidota bacterium]|nr:hypothetical protein [Bacteroidota bacterium]